jgi:hypothetical protein
MAEEKSFKYVIVGGGVAAVSLSLFFFFIGFVFFPQSLRLRIITLYYCSFVSLSL